VAVNLREGMRRLALLLGVVGAILGGFASYLELQSILNQKERHNKFEQFAKSDVVRQEQKSWPLTLLYTTDKALEAFRKLPKNQQLDVIDHLTRKEKDELLAKLNCKPLQQEESIAAETRKDLVTDPKYPGWEVVPGPEKDVSNACSAEASDPPNSTINRNGINTIHWTKTLEVDFLDMADGQVLYAESAPNRWLYLLVVILPLLGFGLPWGLIRAVGWVGTGFFTSTK
jgi:hypothetical protein